MNAQFPQIANSLEVSPQVREMAEKSITQARESYEKIKDWAEGTNGALEDVFSLTSKGIIAYNTKVLEITRASLNASLSLATKLLSVTTLAEVTDLLNDHVKTHTEQLTAHAKDLTDLTQKVTAEAVEPLKLVAEKATKLAA